MSNSMNDTQPQLNNIEYVVYDGQLVPTEKCEIIPVGSRRLRLTPEEDFRIRSELSQKYKSLDSLPVLYDLYPIVLGAGVSAEIMKICLETGQDAVVKRYTIRSARASAGFFQGLDYELEILRQLNHPNILSPMGVSWSDSQPQVFFPLCETSLKSFKIEPDDPNANQIRFQITQQLLSAINYLHQHNIVHGDIKPDNVLILSTNPLRLVLADFGSAIDLKKTEHFPMSSFSEQYCSPALAFSSQMSFGSDLYACALTLLHTFTGSLPWDKPQPLYMILNFLKSGKRVQIPDFVDLDYASLFNLLMNAENLDVSSTQTLAETVLQDTSFYPIQCFAESSSFCSSFQLRTVIEPIKTGLSADILALLKEGPSPINPHESFYQFAPANLSPTPDPEDPDDRGPDWIQVNGNWFHLDDFD